MTERQAKRSGLNLPVLCQRNPPLLRRHHGRRQTIRTGYSRPGSIFRKADRRPYCSRPSMICWLKTKINRSKRVIKVTPVCKDLCPLGKDVLDGSFRKRMKLDLGEPSSSYYHRQKRIEAKARKLRKAEKKSHRRKRSYTSDFSSSLFSTSTSFSSTSYSDSSAPSRPKHAKRRHHRRH